MSQDTQVESTLGMAQESDALAEVSAMQNDPLMILVMFAACLYIGKLWYDDYRQARKGHPHPRAFPGATACGMMAVAVAMAGALVLLGVEIAGEYALDLVGEQSNVTALALLAMMSAAFIEELIFRGYLVIENRGRAALISGMVGFSVVFAVLHPFLWELDYPDGVAGWRFWEAEFSLNGTTKAWFSTVLIFLNSLWFYTVRYFAWNPAHSLIPCFAAHLASNVGVFLTKLAQGHVVAWW